MKRVKNGSKTMPAFGELLTEKQISDVTAYLTELCGKNTRIETRVYQ